MQTKEEKREYNKEYRKKNKESIKQYNEGWKERNPGKMRLNYGRVDKRRLEFYQKAKEEVLTYYGGGILACVQCKESRIDCLTIDHIANNGAEDRRKITSKGRYYIWLRTQNYPKGLQTLCMNCQFIKELEKRRQDRTCISAPSSNLLVDMKSKSKYCLNCDKKTVWIEDAVSDLESATVWHCLECGQEERPDDHTDRGTTADYSPRQPKNPGGIELKIPVGVK